MGSNLVEFNSSVLALSSHLQSSCASAQRQQDGFLCCISSTLCLSSCLWIIMFDFFSLDHYADSPRFRIRIIVVVCWRLFPCLREAAHHMYNRWTENP